jgi:hypothetical protein
MSTNVSLTEPAGDELVGLAGLGKPARVRVREDDGGRVSLDAFFDDFQRVDAGAVNCAAEQLDKLDEPVAVVDKDAAEGLELPSSKCHGEEVSSSLQFSQ